MMDWYNNGHGMSGGGYAVMAVLMVVFLTAVILGIVALIRYTGGERQTTGQPYPNTPQQILAARFARGEIDNEEYQQRIHDLGGRTNV